VTEPLRLANPFRRIVGLRVRPAVHGLAEALVPHHIATLDGAPALSRFHAKGGAWALEPVLGANAAQFADQLPGRYSGRMRAVVQDHLARGLTPPYDYRWGNTHGIYTAPDGTPWVCRAAGDELTLWPLATRPAPAALRTAGLAFIPAPSPQPAAGAVTIAVPGLAAVHALDALWPECGWSYSASGARLANVVKDVVDGYQYARLYEISITGSGGTPQSATLTEVEQGYLWGDTSTHVKVPAYALGTLASIDWHLPLAAPAPAFDAPIHCWYAGEALQVVRYHVDGGEEFSEDNPRPGGTVEPYDAQHGIWATRSGTRNEVRCFTLGGVDEVTREAWSGDTEEVSDIPGTRGFGAMLGGFGGLIQVMLDSQSEREFARTNTDVVTIPFNDREAVVHTRAVNESNAGSERIQNGFWCFDGDQYAGAAASTFCQDLANSNGCVLTGGVLGHESNGFWTSNTQKQLYSGPSQSKHEDCDAWTWWCPETSLGTVGFTGSTVAAFEDQSADYAVTMAVGGQIIDLPSDQLAAEAWVRFIDPNVSAQLAVSTPDATGAPLLYTAQPSPDRGTIGDVSVGPAGYELLSLRKIFTAWLGNP